jgi:hypothetical protein
MAEIRKISLVYDPAEDRVACDTEDMEGATTRLWLTRALCQALVEAVLPMLRPAATQVARPLHEAAVQSFEQAAAMAGLGRAPGVETRPQTVTGLVRALKISPSDTELSFTFEFGEGEVRVVKLGQAETRQALGVMHRLSEAAGWALDVWPAWIVGSGPDEALRAVN